MTDGDGAARRRTPMSIELYGKALQKGLAEIQPGVLHIREETNRFSPKLLEETAGGVGCRRSAEA